MILNDEWFQKEEQLLRKQGLLLMELYVAHLDPFIGPLEKYDVFSSAKIHDRIEDVELLVLYEHGWTLQIRPHITIKFGTKIYSNPSQITLPLSDCLCDEDKLDWKPLEATFTRFPWLLKFKDKIIEYVKRAVHLD